MACCDGSRLKYRMNTQNSYTFAKDNFEVKAAQAGDGSFPSWSFFNALPENDKAKMNVLFQYIAAIGQIKNKEKFKKLELTDDLFLFKQFQIRMPCFWSKSGVLFITHGFVKKQDRMPESEKAKALSIMASQKARLQPSQARVLGEVR